MKRFLIPMFFMILLISQTVYADNEISVNITQERKNVIVSGELEGVTGFHEVTVLIGGVDNALYAKQVRCQGDGSGVKRCQGDRGVKGTVVRGTGCQGDGSLDTPQHSKRCQGDGSLDTLQYSK
ncbi:MAG: hypothetical protein IJ300_00965 [Clostridia bacterium]|nr:hypothetical protein [Clostridia bacterium]